MARRIVLIVEEEQPDGLSARKLILESLQHHVIIAYSAKEALHMLDRMKVDVVLVHTALHDDSCEELVGEIKGRYPSTNVVALSPGGSELCGPVATLDSLRPEQLVRYFSADR